MEAENPLIECQQPVEAGKATWISLSIAPQEAKPPKGRREWIADASRHPVPGILLSWG